MLRPSIFRDNFVDNLFDDMFSFPTNFRSAQVAAMKTDIKEKDGNYELEIELPGYNKEDIKAELKEGYLTVTASKNSSKDEKDEKGNYVRRERYTGSCQRNFYVGDAIEEEDIKAEFKDGILNLVFPKEKEKPAVEEKKHYISIA